MPVYQGRRAGTWRVTIFAQGQQHEWIVEGPKKDALREEALKRLELRARPVARSRAVPAFSTFCLEQYSPHAVQHLGADTWNKVRRYQVATLARLLGHHRIDDFCAEHIDTYKKARAKETWRNEPVKASSINNELRVLKTMLRWGREEAKLPIPDLKFKMLPGAGKGRVRAWTHDEVRRVFASVQALYPHLEPLFVFLLNTGCRKGEARHAEWSWVDLDASMLRIPVTEEWHPKDKEAREVPLSSSLLASVRSMPRRSDRWLFPNRWGVMYETFPEEAYREITKAARVSGGPHTTRHTFASHFLQNRPDLPLLAQLMGHSTTRVTELYAHMLPGHLDRARNAVDMAPPSQNWAAPPTETAKKSG